MPMEQCTIFVYTQKWQSQYTIIIRPGQLDQDLDQNVVSSFDTIWYDIMQTDTFTKRCATGPPCSVNTIPVHPVSTSAFASQPICLHSYNKRKRHTRLTKRWNTSSDCGMWPRRKRVFAFSRHSWGWSETCYLPHETAAARSTWPSSQVSGFTEVYSHTIRCCVRAFTV